MDEPVSKILTNLEESETVRLDRWNLDVVPNDGAKGTDHAGKDNLPLNVINNYFSLGVDAQIALEFHEARGLYATADRKILAIAETRSSGCFKIDKIEFLFFFLFSPTLQRPTRKSSARGCTTNCSTASVAVSSCWTASGRVCRITWYWSATAGT